MRTPFLTAGRAGLPASALLLGLSTTMASQSVRDSAGIVIVENRAPDPAVIAFRVGDTPLLRIGRDSAADGPSLFITEIVSLRDGRYVANDANGGRVRYHDSTGRLIQTVGGPAGQDGLPAGPVRGVRRARGDSIYVLQAASRPVALLDERGRFVRELFPAGEGMMYLSNMLGAQPRPTLIEMFDDGSFVVRGQAPATVRDPAWKPEGDAPQQRIWAIYLRISADGTRVLDTLGIFPGSDRIPTYTFGRSGNTALMSGLAIPGFRRSSIAIDSDRFCYAEGSTYEVRCYSPDGRLLRIVRAAVPVRPFTPDEIARAMEQAVKNLSGAALTSAQQALRGIRFPANRAAIGAMIIDEASRIWVGSATGDAQDRYWTIFSPGGEMLGTVRLPESGRIAWIGTDRIALIRTLGAEGTEVVVYRLDAGDR